MRKIFGVLMLLYGLFVMYVVFGGYRKLINFIGNLNGWGICSNCEDTFWRRKLGFLRYQPLNGEPQFEASLPLCECCLANPCLLDAKTIVENLRQGMSKNRVQRICEAVIRCQNGERNLYRLGESQIKPVL